MKTHPEIAHGEWWRLTTASFFQDGWLLGTIFNLFILAVVGLRAERVFGHWRWPCCTSPPRCSATS